MSDREGLSDDEVRRDVQEEEIQDGDDRAVNDGSGAEEDEDQDERSSRNRNDDDDDDDEDDEEDEEEDMPRRKRARRRGNMFVDVEAEVDEDEEDVEEDDHELLKEDGFIQHDAEEEEGDRDDRLHREVDRRREAIDDEDAERIASEYREKYGRSAMKYRGEQGHVPQRMLLPSVNDPNIWGVRCKPGKEKELVRLLLKKKEAMQYTKHPLEIFSAFQRDTFTGYVYVEARKQAAVTQALDKVPNAYTNSMILVPIKEYQDMFRVNKSKDTELALGSYVRIKRGKYQGDLAIVENISENGLEAQLKIVPRLDYGMNRIIDTMDSKRKRAAARPPPRLFSASVASQNDQGNLTRRGPNLFTYMGEEYDNGYLKKDFKIAHLTTEAVNPRLEEIQRFSGASEDGIDLTAVSESLKQAASSISFHTGDMVQVAKGEQAGMDGRVISAHGGIVTIVGTGEIMFNERMDIPAENLRKKFNIGDHVRVVNGNYKDDTGMVVQVSTDTVTLLSDLSKSEITVFAKDLKAASDIGGATTIGKFELHDLVQLNAQMVGCIVKIERESVGILGQDGNIRTVSPGSITMKVTKGNISATDRNGQEIRVGDTIKETGGERRQGSILHIYRTTIFAYSRNIQENLGVFVGRISNVITVAAKGARGTVSQDLNKMNPAMQQAMPPPVIRSVGRDRIVGQRVTIGKGSQYKGLRGTIRDTTDTEARIELEAKSKVVTVDKMKLIFTNKQGSKVPYLEFVSRRPAPSGFNAPQSMGPPGGGFSGGKTPSWVSGGKTPFAGGKTPSWGGGKTPAFGGGQTPGWAAGGKTPAYMSGGKTPAYMSGGKTPSYAAGGGRTPAYMSGSRTPAYMSGGKTPAWESSRSREAPTPGYYEGYSAPTPGAANAPTPGGPLSAPTPGVFHDDPETAPTPGVFDAKTPAANAMSAPTPGVWGGDDGDTPKYEVESP